jgi:hypothetical protein
MKHIQKEVNKTFSGYQPHQVVEEKVNQGLENHLCYRHDNNRDDNDPRDGSRNLVYSSFNHLTRLLA